MKAKIGDTLVAGSGCTGLIINVLGAEGQPPYVVKWLPGGHIAMVVPDQYAWVIGGRSAIPASPGLVLPIGSKSADGD
jgi:hypothetical protein